jgi:hypothetical protein
VFRLVLIVSLILSGVYPSVSSGAFSLKKLHEIKLPKASNNSGFFYDMKGEFNLLAFNLEKRVIVFDQVTGDKISDFTNSNLISKIKISNDGQSLLGTLNLGKSPLGDHAVLLDLSTGKEIHQVMVSF